MKISYNWLKDYVSDMPSVEETARILTDIGLEVEGLEKIETVKGGLAGVRIGEVLTCEKHPDADKLSVTTVDYGEGPVQIVCGAPNVRAGLKVVVATAGCTLYPDAGSDGFKIKKSKIRGVESNGMLCAEDEIGLGTDHEGIMELPADAVPGMPAREYFRIEDDYLLEIGLTPNRADAASHIGVARDLVAYLKSNGLPGELVLPSVAEYRQDIDGMHIVVEVENTEACPHYTGVTVSGVTVKPSPEWLQNRLRAIGINPKNNLVDVTNFILHETGQPLHAFDADKIGGKKIVVKTVAEGTPFVTLDGVERKLSANDLMICDAERPMCIAGVFGGADSGIGDRTRNVFIESAYFNPVWIRKTAKRHGLNTDASFRYERGIDPNGLLYALKRAALLMKELGDGKISSPVENVDRHDTSPFVVELDMDRVDALIGKKIGEAKIKAILSGLEIGVTAQNGSVLTLAVPAYRVDVKRDVDVIEDILRIYGYNHVEIPLTVHSTLSYAPKPDKDRVANVLSDYLSANGFNEIMSNSLTRSAYYEELKSYPLSAAVKILNPLSSDLNVMRQTLLFNALEAAELNINRKNGNLKLYELGNCYFYNEAKREEGGLAPYREEYRLGVLVAGMQTLQSWREPAVKSDFFTLKAAAEGLLKRFGLDMNEGIFETLESDLYREAVRVKLRGKALLDMGAVARKIRSRFGIKGEVYFMEMNFGLFLSMVKNNRLTVKELSKYPEVKRDLALLVDRSVQFSQLKEVIRKTEKKLVKNITLFDVYEGDKLPIGKKSYALSLILEDTAKTLTDAVIDKTVGNIVYQLEKQCGAELRK